MRSVNQAGIELIKSFEGIVDGDPTTVNLDPYADPIGILTIGWGHAITFGERFLKNTPKDRALAKRLYPQGITRAEAEELLKIDIAAHVRDIEHLITYPLTDNQFAAVASLAFNIGAKNFSKSTLLKLINQGRLIAASQQFELWKRAGGKVLRGLVRRRAAERALFLTPDDCD